MLAPLEPLRQQVRTRGIDALPTLAPVLIAREMLTADLSFAGPDGDATDITDVMVRRGATLGIEDRLTARERLAIPLAPGRRALREELYAPITPGPKHTVTLGRSSECDIQFRDPSVSTRHARVHRMPGTDWCFLVDLGSRNGTTHNGDRIPTNGRAELLSGDEIGIGRTLLVYLTPPDLLKYLLGSL